MGLFSFFKKNKQDRTAQDSGRFYSKDDDAAYGERARAKRPASAGGGATRRAGNDPMLPEKKRARRRLVGAIALALAAAVGLPMLLDSEPKPVAGDIAIQIPSKDKAAPLPVPDADKAVAAEDSVDSGEEVVAAPDAKPAAARATSPAPVTPVTPIAPAAAPREPAAAPEPKADARLAERERIEQERADRAQRLERERLEKERLAERDRAAKAERDRIERDRAEHDRAERLAKQKAEDRQKADDHRKAEARAEDKPAKPADGARALAILEGKGADKPAAKDDKAGAGQKFVLQVAAMSSQEKAAEVQAKLRDAGISSYTQKTSTASGELIRVRIGPLSRDEAEKVRAKLGRLGLSGAMTPV
ncbi:SPOR domain-containing protein [uncultured Massilia sp.]|uniref:SPOR domain-containing protein n=1 Tax=uncultured Massilia sp. TaxID=169973 RepID=UPI0025D6E9CE|nr:SPOR domain-containing protein [uncultured Massilia sp.]